MVTAVDGGFPAFPRARKGAGAVRALALLFLAAWLTACFGGVWFAPAATAAEPAVAGRVLLAAGPAERRFGAGERAPLQRGDPVYEGDLLVTGAGALLQLKMVDDALLILQAESELSIDAYRFDPDRPDAQAARLTLHRGRVRSITGRLGESNRKAFRLNTPIAAIGIRGTDFEVVTDARVTRVRLNRGAVVLAPFGETCRPESLGPCETDRALVLTRDLASPVAELHLEDGVPRLIPPQRFDGRLSASDPLAEGLLPEERAGEVRDRAEEGSGPPPGGGGGGAGGGLPPDFVDKIHWGRWSRIPLEEIPLAVEAGADKETLFAGDVFVLYRDGDFSRLGTDRVEFHLHEVAAVMIAPGLYLPVTVEGGRLAVDFSARTFTTALDLQSAAIGRLALSASGVIAERGLFASREGNMQVLGGFTQGGEQAGYLFQHDLGGGRAVEGVTHWVAP
ncbi:MAG: hypothetical protein KatS3mg124_0482 [Porticoccaceae bacterium]|nr:MAG: hypothetical protein KatS3mg124_0482 [Porticoccaceae bacterium]